MSQSEPHLDESRWPGAHPDFDGHLEYPISKMTDAERLRWAWEGTLLLHFAKQIRCNDSERGSYHKHSSRRDSR